MHANYVQFPKPFKLLQKGMHNKMSAWGGVYDATGLASYRWNKEVCVLYPELRSLIKSFKKLSCMLIHSFWNKGKNVYTTACNTLKFPNINLTHFCKETCRILHVGVRCRDVGVQCRMHQIPHSTHLQQRLIQKSPNQECKLQTKIMASKPNQRRI